MPFANRYRGRNQSPSRSKRTTLWNQGPNDTGTAFSTVTPALWTVGSVVSEPVTIIRLRGWFDFYLESASAVGSGFSGAAGIGIVSTDAFAAGAVPDPNEDLDWPWIWHTFFDVRSITATIADGSNAVAAVQRIEIDSKAMRKQNPAETLFGATETIAESGTATARLFARTRVLDKLA